jgi:hypothetical protein
MYCDRGYRQKLFQEGNIWWLWALVIALNSAKSGNLRSPHDIGLDPYVTLFSRVKLVRLAVVNDERSVMKLV